MVTKLDQEPKKEERSFVEPLLRGLRKRCPCCGEGALFYKYLKLNERCASCGTEIGVIRADDMPAYLTIVLVGHIIVPLAMILENRYAPPTWVHLSIWLPMIVVMTLCFLPAIKGATIGLMWRLGIRGDER